MMNNELKFIGRQVGIVLLVLLIAFIIFCIGLMIGYGVIGNGGDAWSILSPKTWQELFAKFSGQ